MNDEDELRRYVERLMRANNDFAFLVVKVAGSEDFLQMSGNSEGVQLDFPLITPRQRSLESKIRAVAEREGLEFYESEGTDGARFLDVDVNKDASGVAQVCRTFLREVFDARDDARLVFDGDGLA